MIAIENKKTKINLNNANEKIEGLSYSQLIKYFVLNSPKQGGFTWEDIENRLAISNAVKKSKKTIEVESLNYKYLKQLVDKMTWPILHEDLLKFRKDVLEAKERV